MQGAGFQSLPTLSLPRAGGAAWGRAERAQSEGALTAAEGSQDASELPALLNASCSFLLQGPPSHAAELLGLGPGWPPRTSGRLDTPLSRAG